jgi:hypothetical protein
MPTIRPLVIDPPTIGRIYAKAREHPNTAPFGIGQDPDLLAGVLLKSDTEVYEIGDFGGVVIVTDIPGAEDGGEERVARPHIMIWDRSCYHIEDVRGFAVDFMARHRLHRLIAEVPASNERAIRFLEKLGANRVGVFRDRRYGWNGAALDSILYDTLTKDVKST